MLCCCYANTNRGELLSNLSFFFFFFLFCFITLKKYSQSGHMHFKMCIKVMIPLRTSFKREHFIFYKLSDFLCFGSFFFFFFSLPSCWLYNLHSGLVFGRRGRKRGEGAGSKTTKVKKLGFKQMELNPKVNTWRGKVLRPVPRCLVWVARGPLACHFGARVSRLERRRIIERFRVSDIFSPGTCVVLCRKQTWGQSQQNRHTSVHQKRRKKQHLHGKVNE